MSDHQPSNYPLPLQAQKQLDDNKPIFVHSFHQPNYQQVAVENGIFPAVDLFWTDFVRRFPTMDHPHVEKFYRETVRYTLVEESKDEDGKYANFHRCPICQSNWCGQPVGGHKAANCPIPKYYRAEWMMVSSAAYCPSCHSTETYHENCHHKNEVCKTCVQKLQGHRYHQPMLGICDQPLEPGVGKYWRERHYQHVVKESKKKPFAIKMVNDQPLKPYQERQYDGFPPLNVPVGTFGEVSYEKGAEFPGLLETDQNKKLGLIGAQLNRLETEARMKKPASNVLNNTIAKRVESKQKEVFAPQNENIIVNDNLGSKVEQVSSSSDQQASNQPEPIQQEAVETAEERFEKAKTYVGCNQSLMNDYLKSIDKKDYVKVTDECKQIARINSKGSNYQPNKKTLEKGISELYKDYQHENVYRRIQKLQIVITGYFEDFKSVGNLYNNDMEQYFQFLLDLAMMLKLNDEATDTELIKSEETVFSVYTTDQHVIVPSSTVFLAATHRYHFFSLWLMRVAQALKLKTSN